MPEIMHVLKEAMNSENVITFNSSNVLEIIEEKNQIEGSGQSVKFKNTGKSFVFTLDNLAKDPFPYFASVENIKKRNDAILFCEEENKVYVFIIELKSKKTSGAIKQIKSGISFVNFILNLLQLNYDITPHPNGSNYEYRSIIFNTSSRNANRRPTKKKVEYENIDDILVAYEQCNKTYDFKKTFI